MPDFHRNFFSIKIPRESAKVFQIRDKMVCKGTVDFAAQARLVPGAPADVPSGEFDTTTRVSANRRGETTVSATTQIELENDIKLGISTGVNLDELERVLLNVATANEVNANLFQPLFSGLSARASWEQGSLTLSWDSDLCFIKLSGTFEHEIENHKFSAGGSFKFGITSELWAKLFAKIANAAPSPQRFVTKIRSVLTRLFGAAALRSATVLRGLFAGMSRLSPYMWAIEIALFLQDFTLVETRRRRAEGYRDGNLVAFATTFTKTIFNYSIDFEPGAIGDVQRQAAEYANRYRGRRRIAVQRYLNLYYGNGTSVRNSRAAQRVGEQFGIAGLGSLSPRNGNPHISRSINRYVDLRIDPWVSQWRTTNRP